MLHALQLTSLRSSSCTGASIPGRNAAKTPIQALTRGCKSPARRAKSALPSSSSLRSVSSISSLCPTYYSRKSYHVSTSPISTPKAKSTTESVQVGEKQTKKVTLIIDSSPLIFQAFHAIPTLGNGVPLNAVYGFLRSLIKLIREIPCTNLNRTFPRMNMSTVVCMEGGQSFRKEMDPNYKAHRKETPEELIKQFPIVEEALAAFGIACRRVVGFEADDIIATYAKIASEQGNEVLVISPDKDLCQVVNTRVSVKSGASGVLMNESAVIRKYGVTPAQLPHLQALLGDSTDNIPKVSGLSPAASKSIINQFGSVQEALASVDTIKEMASRDALRMYSQQIKQSYTLAKLRDDVPVPDLELSAYSGISQKGALAFCSKYKLKSIATTLQKLFEELGPTSLTSTEPNVGTLPLPSDSDPVVTKKAPGRPRKSKEPPPFSLAELEAAAADDIPQPTLPSPSSTITSKKLSTLPSGMAGGGRARLLKIRDEAIGAPAAHSYEETSAMMAEQYYLDAQNMLETIAAKETKNEKEIAISTLMLNSHLDRPSLAAKKEKTTSSSSSATSTTRKSTKNAVETKPASSEGSISSASTSDSTVPSTESSSPQQDEVKTPLPPVPRARRKRSPSTDAVAPPTLDGHVSEEVDIDTDPTVVALTKKYKESRGRKSKAEKEKEKLAAAAAAAIVAGTTSDLAQNQEPIATNPESAPSAPSVDVNPTIVQSIPSTSAPAPTIDATISSSKKQSSAAESAANFFLETLKKNSSEPDLIDQALKNPGSLSTSATRKPRSRTTANSAESDSAMDVATIDASPLQASSNRGRKPKVVVIDDFPSHESVPSSTLESNQASTYSTKASMQSSTASTVSDSPAVASSASSAASKRKNPVNGPGSRTAASESRGGGDGDEDDEESNLELVDYIKKRTMEVDVEFVNLFKLCKTPKDRRRVIESKLKGVTVANDKESAERILAKLLTLTNRFHACDTETIDLDLKKEGPVGHGRIICASIYVGPDIDFGNGPRIWIDNLDDDSTLELFRGYFESETIKKVWHNYGFDRHVFYNHGIDVKGFGGDTLHMARLWDSSRRGAKAYSLETLSRDLLLDGKEGPGKHSDSAIVAKTSMKQRFGRVKLKKDGTPSKSAVILPALDEIQRDAMWLPEWVDYSTLDAEDTWRLHEVLAKKLKNMEWVAKQNMLDFYNQMWLPFGELLTDMERRGIKVDREYLRDLVPKALKEKADGEKQFVDWAVQYVGPECRFMNPGSDAQKQQLLFAPCTNKVDPSKTMPATREFETENTEGFIEEGKKVAKKKRSFIITGLGLPFEDATDAGWPAVSHPVLAKLVGDPPEKYGPLRGLFEKKGLGGGKEACDALSAAVEASKIDTLIGTFMVPLAEFADEQSRIHCSLNINTETGRLSSRRPNLQNQPAHEKDRFKIRKAFTCEPGNNLIVADYGQLELRLLAHMTNCKSMIEAFRSGGDFHSRTALGMYSHVKQAIDEGKVLLEWDGAKGKAPLPLLKDEFGTERRRAKTLNFSIAYGKTVMGLAKDWNVSPDEARETLDKWYADRPEVKHWQQRTIDRAHRTGWTRTLLGRYRPLPDINSTDRTKRGHSERAAINTPLQGGAADITTRAMILLHRHERLRQLGWHQLLQIHDELILEGPKESTEEALSIVVDVMSHPLPEPLLIDLVVDANAASTWYEAK